MSQLNMVPVGNNADNGNNANNNNNNVYGGLTAAGVEFYNASSSENQEEWLGNDQDPRPSQKKRYHRHSQSQIHEMEAFFKECPHPDDKQRKELSQQLGLDPLQIKFWFQNKRTQMKAHQERHENMRLRAQNEILKADNQRYRDAIQNASCPQCAGKTAVGEMCFEEHQLRIENAELKEEIGRLSALAARCAGKMVVSHPNMSHPAVPPPPSETAMRTIGSDVHGNGNLLGSITRPAEAVKPIILELAIRAMEELMTMTQVGAPLWLGEVDGTSFLLSMDEYSRTFLMGLGPKPDGFRTEASKDTSLVPMNYMSIVEMFMTENQWTNVFCGMIARGMTHEHLLIGSGAGHLDGALQIMSTELKMHSPLVSTRESYFVRYCKKHADGVWAVVDVSIDHLLPNFQLNCRKRPSGCLIQEMPSGNFAKITWVEHVEVNDAGGVYHMFHHLIYSGHAFSASRWLATLHRECERVASIVATGYPYAESGGPMAISDQGKRSILKLAERMVRRFLGEATTLLGSTFTGSVGEDVRVMALKSMNDPGKPSGIVLCAATSFWVSDPPHIMFDFLRDENNRCQWDVMSNRGMVQKLTQIGNGKDVMNCVALLRTVNTNQDRMMMVQETSTDSTASSVIFAPLDMVETEKIISGADSDDVALLPSGFVILPDGVIQRIGQQGGSLITVSFQMLVGKTPAAQLTVSSVATIENLVRATVLKIKELFPIRPGSQPPFGYC